MVLSITNQYVVVAVYSDALDALELAVGAAPAPDGLVGDDEC